MYNRISRNVAGNEIVAKYTGAKNVGIDNADSLSNHTGRPAIDGHGFESIDHS